jgi:hypothetical protein
MPFLDVVGIPTEQRTSSRVTAYRVQELPNAASSVSEMCITPKLVTVSLRYEPEANGREVIVLVQGLFVRDQRTPDVLKHFARALRDCTVGMVHYAIPQCEKVEVFDPNNPNYCFADWEKE